MTQIDSKISMLVKIDLIYFPIFGKVRGTVADFSLGIEWRIRTANQIFPTLSLPNATVLSIPAPPQGGSHDHRDSCNH